MHFTKSQWLWLSVCIWLTSILSACGGGSSPPSQASTSDLIATGSHAGPTPFIAFVALNGSSLGDVSVASYSIRPKPGTASMPVHVAYHIESLMQRGYFVSAGREMILPVFGLYSGTANEVSIELTFRDDSKQALAVTITTAAYSDPDGIYDKPAILQARLPGSSLGFSFFAMKSIITNPIIVDTDGEIRWVAPMSGVATSSTFVDNAFVVGNPTSTEFVRLELDGATTNGALVAPTYANFHHNIDTGKDGLVAEVNVTNNGVANIASVAAEFSTSGAILKQWDLAALIENYMRSQGDDPATFVRPGTDWFHMNSTTYDRADDGLIVSSRENFIVKLDYSTGAIRWIFGDPTKYWHSFASLRAKALTLPAGELYPIGQHSTSLTSNGLMMIFNDGVGSFNQPEGMAPGESRSYSAVSAYAIDPSRRTIKEVWRFDHGQDILSGICSSAYEASDRSVLVDYSDALGGAADRVLGLNSRHDVIFDFQYTSPGPCKTSWNAQIVPLESLSFR